MSMVPNRPNPLCVFHGSPWRIEGDDCDCGDIYGCGHGLLPYAIVHDDGDRLTFVDVAPLPLVAKIVRQLNETEGRKR
jgi:hypothetical protein